MRRPTRRAVFRYAHGTIRKWFAHHGATGIVNFTCDRPVINFGVIATR
jgi:hypothetical protein